MDLWEDAKAKYERQRYEEQVLKQAQQLAQEIDNNPLHEFHYVVKVDEEAVGLLRQFVQIMRRNAISPIPCVIPMVGTVSKHRFARDEQIIRAVDAKFNAWPVADKYKGGGYQPWQPGFAVTEQAKLVKAFRATINELVSKDEVEWGTLVNISRIMRISYNQSGPNPKVGFHWQVERTNLSTMLVLKGSECPYSQFIRNFRDVEYIFPKKGLGVGDVLYSVPNPTGPDDPYIAPTPFLLKDVLSNAVLKLVKVDVNRVYSD